MSGKFPVKNLKFLPFYLVSIFPLRFLYLISDLAFLFIYYLARYRRRVVRSNLENAFPQKSAEEIIAIEREFYHHFCDLIFEIIKALTFTRRVALKRVRLKNTALLKRFYREKRNVILYGAHFGNWEWYSFIPLHISYQCTTLYQPLANKYFDELIRVVRGRYHVLCIPSNKGFRTLLRLSRENKLSLNSLVGDQSPNLSSPMYWTSFLNQETAFLTGAERIASKSDMPIVYPYFRKLKRGYYEIEIILLEEFPKKARGEEILEKYVRLLEKNIVESPAYWLWSHRRWKLSKASVENRVS